MLHFLRRKQSIFVSAFTHALLLVLLFSFAHPERFPKIKNEILIEVPRLSNDGPAHSKVRTSHLHQSNHAALDLRPGFLKNGFFGAKSSNFLSSTDTPVDSTANAASDSSKSQSDGFLNTNGRSLQAFDLLASLINSRVDYPDSLAEQGISGLATIDLYFDHNGRVDEPRTHTFGSHRLVRGLLVKAVRKGLTDWYAGAGKYLSPKEFRNQHFHADFLISYSPTEVDADSFQKVGEGSYRIAREHVVQTCVAGGVDLICIAMKIDGAVKRKTSATYRAKYGVLIDQLEEFDQIDLRGINQEIEASI